MAKNSKEGLVKSSKNVKMEEVEKAEDICVQKLIIGKDGSTDVYMRKFTMEPGGNMVLHKHDNTDHVQYVLEGKIKITLDGNEQTVEKDDIIFIPKGTAHSYQNFGEKDAKFLCMISAVEVDTELIE